MDESPPESSSRVIKLKGLFGLLIDTQDETVIRPSTMPFPHLQANPNFVDGVASRDVVISDSPSIWARVFLPEKASLVRDDKAFKKVPVILYFHGGAFVILSPDIAFYHQYCEKVARKTNAVVVSVDYRLIPENRLPAAYDDAFTALSWLKTQATAGNELVDPWLATYADFGKIFLMGDSAGANIVHHLSVRASSSDLEPLAIRGQILVQPMTGGPDRLRSEVVGAKNGSFSFQTNDWLWRLALPKGSDMSHPYCNLPAAVMELAKVPLPPALVVLGGVDWMHDRQFEYVASLRKTKKEVELLDYEKAKHGFFIYDTEETGNFLRALAGFVTKRSREARA
ncbi:probable carboxylesterase 120 [Selaginella moellendorffii]|nr:probable carboxylesterase 120 [Selaginella moellendorffii]|eukprot:XP_002987495.2 probable carboxylesterase 120 [Selaginella moellendorffii]